ncbi:MAG: CPBP family intramembrane metalloprotease [Planctomycetaceae bacterium]|nr:CPBP family intramembrane metalloprotease [Planctomycetaceae bacterium]
MLHAIRHRSAKGFSATMPSAMRAGWAEVVFLLPWFLVYEAGIEVLRWGWRGGADLWMRTWLETQWPGAGACLPLLIVAGLLVSRWEPRRPSRPSNENGDVKESGTPDGRLGHGRRLLIASAAAFGLVAFGSLWMGLWSGHPAADVDWSETRHHLVIAFFGAGLHEEILFRGLLMGGMIAALRLMRIPVILSTGIGLVSSSLIFGFAHLIPPTSLPDWSSLDMACRQFTEQGNSAALAFRCLAGCYFGVLTLRHGLGVAAVAHVLYDIVVGVVLPDANSSW